MNDADDLKRQERKFVWKLVGFVFVTCAGAIAFLVTLPPRPEKPDQPNLREQRLIQQMTGEAADRQRASIALEQMATLARECQKLDDEALKLLGEELKKPAEGRTDKSVFSKLQELNSQRESKVAQLEKLSFADISADEAAKLEAERNQARDINSRADAFIKRLKSQLETQKGLGAQQLRKTSERR